MNKQTPPIFVTSTKQLEMFTSSYIHPTKLV